VSNEFEAAEVVELRWKSHDTPVSDSLGVHVEVRGDEILVDFANHSKYASTFGALPVSVTKHAVASNDPGKQAWKCYMKDIEGMKRVIPLPVSLLRKARQGQNIMLKTIDEPRKEQRKFKQGLVGL
nr:hypothetical protein [Candidatus Sigynarchaeota archaeon]